MLHEFLTRNRPAILARSVATIRNRVAPGGMDAHAADDLPSFFDQVIDTLRHAELDPKPREEPPNLVPCPPTLIGSGATQLGRNLHSQGFSVTQVVHVYGTICESVTQVADELGQPIGVAEFHLFNQCLDDAIGQAVGQFERDRDDVVASQEIERLGFLAHELRNTLSAAMMALHIIKQGVVGVGGKTGLVLDRNLVRMRQLIDRSLTEVRLRSDAEPHLEPLFLNEVIDEIVATTIGEAQSQDVVLDIHVEPGLELDADRQMLVSAIANLLQNGLKRTPPGCTLALRSKAVGNRITVEVEDRCGGLPEGGAEALGYASSRRRATESSGGLGLGLAIAHQAVGLHGGSIQVRNLPGKGCIFTIDIPMSGLASDAKAVEAPPVAAK